MSIRDTVSIMPATIASRRTFCTGKYRKPEYRTALRHCRKHTPQAKTAATQYFIRRHASPDKRIW
ncbi:MAG: hypothetical protein LBR08_06115 [Bacteroidales bacterium]|nr:hypothetical protein [Bacteroidales bacterium]